MVTNVNLLFKTKGFEIAEQPQSQRFSKFFQHKYW